MYYVRMQITFPIPKFARKELNLHCDVVHITTVWVSRLVLDHATTPIQTSRQRPIVTFLGPIDSRALRDVIN